MNNKEILNINNQARTKETKRHYIFESATTYTNHIIIYNTIDLDKTKDPTVTPIVKAELEQACKTQKIYKSPGLDFITN